MTGKEALEKMLGTLKHWQGRNTIFDKAQADCILKELELLEKYKSAFEILKPIINMDNNIEEGGKEYWLSDIWGLRKLTKEEYELLEELMK